jgi:hypothetical protein
VTLATFVRLFGRAVLRSLAAAMSSSLRGERAGSQSVTARCRFSGLCTLRRGQSARLLKELQPASKAALLSQAVMGRNYFITPIGLVCYLLVALVIQLCHLRPARVS